MAPGLSTRSFPIVLWEYFSVPSTQVPIFTAQPNLDIAKTTISEHGQQTWLSQQRASQISLLMCVFTGSNLPHAGTRDKQLLTVLF